MAPPGVQWPRVLHRAIEWLRTVHTGSIGRSWPRVTQGGFLGGAEWVCVVQTATDGPRLVQAGGSVAHNLAHKK